MSVGNTGSRMVGNTEFYGGLSTDNKIGIENSYADGECLDVRKSPGQMTVLPMARQFSDSGVVTGLMVAMTQTKDGNIWGIDEGGKLYKIDENDAITAVSTTATSSGFGLVEYTSDDGLWFSDGGHSLFSYGKIINPTGASRSTTKFEFIKDISPRMLYVIEMIVDGDTVDYNYNSSYSRSAGESTCDVPTTVDETIESGTESSSRYKKNAALFMPATVSVYKIGVRFEEKPASGTVRIEVHDESDNVVASSSTIDAANVSTTDYTEFEVRPNPSAAFSKSNQLYNYTPWSGNTSEAGVVYHIHIVASVTGFSVRTSEDDDMFQTLDMTSTSTALLETYNEKHPMVKTDKLYIGNGRYVATKTSSPLNYVDASILSQNALRLDDGFEVCCFCSSDEYMIIGAEKYSVGSTRGFQNGRIYFWDSSTEDPSFYIDCPMGSPKTMFNFNNIIYIIISGALYAYTGGQELVKVRTLQGTDTEYSGTSSVTEVYPNMMAIRREILMLGFPSTTTATTIRHGVHGFGSIDKNYPNCFTYNYRVPGATVATPISQYNSSTHHLRIGCVYNFNDTMFYSYEVGTKSGDTWTYDPSLALIDNSSGTSTTFSWKSLQYDAGSPAYEKMALRIGIYFNTLPANTTITPIYRIDDGEWVNGPVTATTGDNYITCDINQRFHELQYGFTGTTGNDTLTPVIKQVAAEVRVLNEEAKL